MQNTYQFKNKSTNQITLVSIIALLMGHLMILTYIPNIILNFGGLLITSYFIFYNTLRKNDIFSFVMVMYFCSAFPYLGSKGGGFNMVSLVCVCFYLISMNKLPFEKKNRDSIFKMLVGLFVMSSVLGWLFNYTGNGIEIVYSVITFFGIVLLLIVSSSLEITTERLKVFLKLNFILIIYSTIASLNKYLHIITFETPMLPIYGSDESGYFEGGGIMGVSPIYGEHSMVLATLFSIFLILGKKRYGRTLMLILGSLLSFINVFMSISRSVFMLSLAGLVFIYILQFKLEKINLSKQFGQIILIGFLSFGTLWIIKQAGLGYVFDRVSEIEERNKKAGGVTIENIIDGSAFNRKTAFDESYKRYASRDSWVVGYGWGIGSNNRDAYYTNQNVKRGTAHSQIFAVLFILGWIGFIAYFGLILRIIIKSYKTTGNLNVAFTNRLMAFFFMIAFALFLFNEIKVDSINFPNYFAVTIIWMGLGYSNLNNIKLYALGKVI